MHLAQFWNVTTPYAVHVSTNNDVACNNGRFKGQKYEFFQCKGSMQKWSMSENRVLLKRQVCDSRVSCCYVLLRKNISGPALGFLLPYVCPKFEIGFEDFFV